MLQSPGSNWQTSRTVSTKNSRRTKRPCLLVPCSAPCCWPLHLGLQPTLGINAILYYLNEVFADAGYSRLSVSSLAVTVGVMNLIATIGAISIIDKVGRRPPLLLGSTGTAASLGLVAWIFYHHQHVGALIWLLAVYMMFFAISQGAVIWVYISEIFPNAVRARGQSVGTTTHWVMNAAISGIFPVLAMNGMWLLFSAFSIMMLVQLLFVVFKFLPETRGLTLEQVTSLLKHKSLS